MNIVRSQTTTNRFNIDSENTPSESLSNNVNTLAGVIVDLSPFGGRLLIPDSTSLVSDRIFLHLYLSGQQSNVILQSKILWNKTREPFNHIEVGCEFIRPSNNTKLKLMQYIRENTNRQRRMIVRCELL